MRRSLLALSLYALIAATPATAAPACESFPSWIDRIYRADNISQIDDVMVEFGAENRLGEEGLKGKFHNDLNAAKYTAAGVLLREEYTLCPSKDL